MIIVNHRLEHFQHHQTGIEMQREKITLGWAGKSAPVADVTFVEVEATAPAAPVAPARAMPAVTAWSDPDPLDLCLELWAAWMAHDADRDMGIKTMRGLSGDGDGRGVDLHEAQQATDTRIAQATDAMIDSMARIHIWAIYKLCSQATPWRFPNAVFADVALEARAELTRRLKNNVCTAVLF
ncbi:hypothetical protein G3257_11460 [Janthinobacterium lividum]|uniref:hypothetical protein n=1 Tax=Janthinobacterium lividum TaxID=29581 RepID=UPI001595897B|nr:hypothetical protein [Janthinobacterium lividum]QKY02798.1 hypothetical protein G3257_11460 [Janthinobacterium lividum]